jgi:predicted DNA-binding transcriptional regulator YafY
MKVKVRISYEFISWLMGWGGIMKVLKPKSLIDSMLAKAKEITDTYK